MSAGAVGIVRPERSGGTDVPRLKRVDSSEPGMTRLREVTARHLDLEGFPRERVLACAVRLLDIGFFRVGSEDYADQNATFGLATMERRHVSLDGDLIRFDYVSKGGKRRIQSVV